MSKIFNALKEIFLNLVLVSLVFILLILMYLNWQQGLNIENIPDDFFAYEQIMKFLEKEDFGDYEIQSQQFVTPNKISIKNNGKFYGVIYDQLACASAYDLLFSDIDDIENEKIIIENSTLEEFLQATEQDEFAYIEFLSPLSAIINIESDIFVTDIIAIQKEQNIEFIIKSDNQFYKIIILDKALGFSVYETLSDDYEFLISDKGVVNLISEDSFSVNEADISTRYVDLSTKQQIISTFLYNPAVVTSYETSYDEQIYVNEYSTISIANSYIEFESTDPRGNIFNEQYDSSATQMIDFAMDIFNDIYGYLDSSILAHPSDFYYEDGQAVVVLSGELDGFDVNLGEPFGIFVFSTSGLSYCKINVVIAELAQTKISLVKSTLLETENKIIIGYDLNGQAGYKYYFDKE